MALSVRMTRQAQVKAPRSVSSLFCLAALLNQIILPVAHEWRVVIAEAKYHSADAGLSRTNQISPEKATHHIHHNPDDCAICSLAARMRLIPSTISHVCASFRSFNLACSEILAASSVQNEAASPRGPPLA